MDYFAELWMAAKQAGPFACLVLLFACYVLDQERKTLQKKYDDLVERFLQAGIDNKEALKDLRDMFQRAVIVEKHHG